MNNKSLNKYIIIAFLSVVLISVFLLMNINGAQTKTVFLCDGGNGDGSTFDSPLGDIKKAVRMLSKTGGDIVICGKYTYYELINLSEKEETANGNNTIKVTSVYGENDYRTLTDASLCVGNKKGSANMILAGNFIFENLNIITSGSENPRAVICMGNKTEFGDGIVCKKTGQAPYLSIVGGAFDGTLSADCEITIKSGTYNYVTAGNRNGSLNGNTILTIDGGNFEGVVSVTGLDNADVIQNGRAVLTVNGGSFGNKTGSLSPLAKEFIFTINGGTFRNEIIASGLTNTIDINGGSLQNVSLIKISDTVLPEETDNRGNIIEPEKPENKSAVNINSYSGDVQKLVGKIQGDNVVINKKTEGGVDAETEIVTQQETIPPETTAEKHNSEGQTAASEKRNDTVYREYLLGNRQNTVLAIVVLVAIVFSSILILAYRMVYRKK